MNIVINIQNSLWDLDINMKNIIATWRILHTLSPLLPTGPLSPYKDEKQFLELEYSLIYSLIRITRLHEKR